MINHTSLKQLDIFVKVIEFGGLSEAAKHLHITPSAISRSLSQLESNLGTLLMKRTTRTIILTQSGQYLYARALKLLNDFDESINTTAGFYSLPQGELRVTCSMAFGYSQLITLAGKYRQQYPNVNLSVDLNDNLVNLNDTNFDIAIRITATPPDNYALRKIAPINWSFCASPEYLEKYGMPNKIEELEKHLFLLYPTMSPLLRKMDETGHSRPLNIHSPIQANSSLALLKALLEHQGIAYLPTYLTGEYVKNGQLKPLILDDKLIYKTHSLYALYFPSRYSNPKVRSFIDFFIQTIKPQPYWDEWMNIYTNRTSKYPKSLDL